MSQLEEVVYPYTAVRDDIAYHCVANCGGNLLVAQAEALSDMQDALDDGHCDDYPDEWTDDMLDAVEMMFDMESEQKDDKTRTTQAF